MGEFKLKPTYKEIEESVEGLGTIELYDLESTIRKEFIKRMEKIKR
jgi:hypothetical protein